MTATTPNTIRYAIWAIYLSIAVPLPSILLESIDPVYSKAIPISYVPSENTNAELIATLFLYILFIFPQIWITRKIKQGYSIARHIWTIICMALVIIMPLHLRFIINYFSLSNTAIYPSLEVVNSTIGIIAMLVSLILLFQPGSNKWFKELRAIRKLQEKSEISSDKRRLKVIALAIPFGIFGAHRFYLGRIASGATMLSLLIVSVVAIIIAIDTYIFPLVIQIARNQGEVNLKDSDIMTFFAYFIPFCCSIVWWLIDIARISYRDMRDGNGQRVTK